MRRDRIDAIKRAVTRGRAGTSRSLSTFRPVRFLNDDLSKSSVGTLKKSIWLKERREMVNRAAEPRLSGW